jgi:hypothetical protein
MYDQSTPRWINVALGAWLIISAFAWPHTSPQFANALIVGAICAVAAAFALRTPQVRFVNVALAIWLFVSSWALPIEHSATIWNGVVASLIMLVAALVPSNRTLAIHR